MARFAHPVQALSVSRRPVSTAIPNAVTSIPFAPWTHAVFACSTTLFMCSIKRMNCNYLEMDKHRCHAEALKA
jgi:hypothetical protein